MAEATYTNEYSQLPESVLPERQFLDVTDAIAVYINEVKNKQAQGKYAEAAQLIQTYKSQGVDLTNYIIDSSFINLLEEEIRNLEIYCKVKKQVVYYSSFEPICQNNDVWIG